MSKMTKYHSKITNYSQNCGTCGTVFYSENRCKYWVVELWNKKRHFHLYGERGMCVIHKIKIPLLAHGKTSKKCSTVPQKSEKPCNYCVILCGTI